MSCLIENFLEKTTHPTWGVVTLSPLVHFCQIFNGTDALEESSIYFLDTINNGALLQKQRANPTLSVQTLACLAYLL
jgi:hypothetical protein